MATLFDKGEAAKYINFPLSNCATWPHDKQLHDVEIVGVSTFSGYSYNERSMLSLGYVDLDVPIGAELVMVWARKAVGRPSRSSSGTGRRRSGSS
jgi:vanillate/3-O-methylgallate O-demethylase